MYVNDNKNITLLTNINKESKSLRHSKYFYKKFLYFLVLLLFVLIVNNTRILVLIFPKQDDEVICTTDYLFDVTFNMNAYLTINVILRHSLLIISSFLIDSLIVYTLYVWVFKCSDWILPKAVVLFYSFRQLLQYIYIKGMPENYIFDYPGLMSLTVSYKVTNDFFYSGHVGLPTIFLKEYMRMGNKKMMLVCLGVIIVECTVMILLRGHYTIDLIFGIIAGLYFHKIIIKYS